MFNSSEIASLKEQITGLGVELASAKVSFETASTELSTVKASLEALQCETATLEASVSDLTAKLSDAEAAKIAAEASIETKVTERLASAGVDPIKRDPQAKQGDVKTTPDASQPPLQRAAAAVGQWSVFTSK